MNEKNLACRYMKDLVRVVSVLVISIFVLTAFCTAVLGLPTEDESPMDPICGHIAPSILVVHNTTFNESVTAATFFIYWMRNESDLMLTLVTPNGTRINSTVRSSSVVHGKDGTYEYYIVYKPQKGVWSFEIRALDVLADGGDYCLLIDMIYKNATLYDMESTDLRMDTNGGGLYCGHINSSSTLMHNTTIDSNISAAQFLLSWTKADIDLELVVYSSDGTRIEPLPDYSIIHGEEETIEYYIVQDPLEGNWTVKITSIDVPVGGEDYCISINLLDKRDRDRSGKVDRGNASFSGIYYDYATDVDGDGLYDLIAVEVGVNVVDNGFYTVAGKLYDLNGSDVSQAFNDTYLDVEAQTVLLIFQGMRSPGPYRLKNLSLCGEAGVELDYSTEAYSINAYDNLDLGSQLAELTGNYTDYGVDVDSNGLYDYLAVDVGVDVYKPGNYGLTGYLYDDNGTGVVWSFGYRILDVGTHTIHMDFNGKTIEEHGVNGRYHLKSIILFSGSSDTNLTICDGALGTYTTSAYNSLDFVDPESKEKEVAISGVGFGELSLITSFNDTIPVFSGRYIYDLIGINIPSRQTNFTISTSEVKNLKLGIKKMQDNTTRIWIAQTFAALEGIATATSDLPSPGNYHVKIFGDAAEEASIVDLELTLDHKIKANGTFNLRVDYSRFPAGDYTIAVKALNGSFTDLTLDGLPLAP